MITKPVDVANHYAAYFENKINRLRKMTDFSSSKDTLNDLIDTNIMLNKMCSFSLSFVTTKEVIKLLESLPDEKAAGYDLMDNRLLRYAAPQITAPLRYLYNWSMTLVTSLEYERKLIYVRRILKNLSHLRTVGPLVFYLY